MAWKPLLGYTLNSPAPDASEADPFKAFAPNAVPGAQAMKPNQGLLGDSFGILTPEQQQADLDARFADVDNRQKLLGQLDRRLTEAKSPYQRRALEVQKLNIERGMPDIEQLQRMEAGDAPLATKSGLRSGVENTVTGLSDTVLGLPEFAGIMSGYMLPGQVDDNALLQWSQQAKDYVRERFPGDAVRQADFSQQLATGLGQIATFYGTGGLAALAKVGPKAMVAILSSLGAATTGSQGFEEGTAELKAARDKAAAEGNQAEVTEYDRLLKTLGYTAIGTTEAIPIARTFSRVAPDPVTKMGHRVVQSLEGAAEEAIQEAGSQAAQNLTTQQTTDPSRPTLQGVAESAGVGGTLGGLMNFLLPGRFTPRGQAAQPQASGPAATPLAPAPEPTAPQPPAPVTPPFEDRGALQTVLNVHREGSGRPEAAVAELAGPSVVGPLDRPEPAPERAALQAEVSKQIYANPNLAGQAEALLAQLDAATMAPAVRAAEQRVRDTGKLSAAAFDLVQSLAAQPVPDAVREQFSTEPTALNLRSGRPTASARPPAPALQPIPEGSFATPDIMAALGGAGGPELDRLGFYSKALETARQVLPPDAVFAPEQAIGILQNNGVKPAEIQATGLDRFVADKRRVTGREVAAFLQQNRVNLQENRYGGQAVSTYLFEYQNGYNDDGTFNVEMRDRDTGQEFVVTVDNAGGNVRIDGPGGVSIVPAAPPGQQGLESARVAIENWLKARAGLPDVKGPVRWEKYSLDPGNPTYRETVLHLDESGKLDALRQERRQLEHIPLGRVLPDGRTVQQAIDDIDRRFEEAKTGSFQSGHWDEPNIIAHLRSQELQTPDGRRVLNLDELQSDWGQKIREGGARDEAKIAALRQQVAEAVQQLQAHNAKGVQLRSVLADQYQLHNTGSSNVEGWFQSRAHESDFPAAGKAAIQQWFSDKAALKEKQRLADAELRTAEAATPAHPLVRSTDQWVTTALRNFLRQAAEADVDGITITPGDVQNERYGLGGVIDGVAIDTGMNEGRRQVQLRRNHYNNASGYSIFGSLVVDPDGKVFNASERIAQAKGHQLSEVVGREAADRIMAAKDGDVLTVQQLEVGKEGMRATYDNIYPKALAKLLKKLDPSIRPGKTKVWPRDIDPENPVVPGIAGRLNPFQRDFAYFPLTEQAKTAILSEGQPLFAIGGGIGHQRTGERSGRTASGSLAPLKGAPVVEGATGPDPSIVAVAEQYARNHGIDLKRQAEFAKINEALATRIAAAYEAMPHAPDDPRVKAAYADMIAQTIAQYRALEDAGYQFWFYDETTDPYAGNPWNSIRDLRQNKSMAVFATEAGFGSGVTDLDVSGSPMLADTGIRWPYGSPDGPLKRVLANDLFRAVHDMFGHSMEGAGFRARGEENAWQAHIRLYTGLAQGAVTSETRGQNSWLNFGPFGQQNQTASVEDTVFADQKIGLMPEWTWQDGRVPDEAGTLRDAEIAEVLGLGAGLAQQWVDGLSAAYAGRDWPGPDAAAAAMATMVTGGGQSVRDMRKALESEGFQSVPLDLLDQGVLVAQTLAAGRDDTVLAALAGFYNPAIKAVQDNPMKSAVPEKWQAFLRKAGIPQQHLRWMGIDEWLDERPKGEPISKERLLAFMDQHQIELDEVVKRPLELVENDADVVARAEEIFNQELDAYVDSQSGLGYEPTAGSEVYQTEEGLWTYKLRIVDGLDFAEEESDAEYDSETEAVIAAEAAALDRSDELLRNWEDQLRTAAADEGQVSWADAVESAVKELGNLTMYGEYAIEGGREEDYRELLIRVPKLKDRYRSAHFDDYEIVHIRFDHRRDLRNGGETAFIHEIQSDLHQHAREHGYRDERHIDAINAAWNSPEAQEYRLAGLARQRATDAARVLAGRARWAEGRDPAAIQTWPQHLRGEIPEAELGPAAAAAGESMERSAAASNALKPVADALASLLGLSRDSVFKILDARTPDKAMTYWRGQTFPDAPYKDNDWWQLALKRMLAYAVSHGYDAIALPTAEQVSGTVGMPIEAAKRFYEEQIPNFLRKYTKKWGATLYQGEVPGIEKETYYEARPDVSAEEAIRYFRAWIDQSDQAVKEQLARGQRDGRYAQDARFEDLQSQHYRNQKAALLQVIGRLNRESAPDVAKLVRDYGLGRIGTRYLVRHPDGSIEDGNAFRSHDPARQTPEDVRIPPITEIKSRAPAQTYVPITNAMREDILANGQAMAKAGNDLDLRRAVKSRLAMGYPVEFGDDIIADAFVAMEPGLAALPADMPVGVLKKITPIEGDEDGVMAQFMLRDGKTVDYEFDRDALLTMRAFFKPGGLLAKPGVFFVRYGSPRQSPERLIGELRHEAVHALRRLRRLDGAIWRRLLDHAKQLRILNLRLSDYLEMLGAPFNRPGDDVLLGALYHENYKHRPDYTEVMEQEYVAHMLELYSHGRLTQEQSAPVRQILNAINRGDFARGINKQQEKAGTYASSQPSYPQTALDALPPLDAKDRRILRQEAASLAPDGRIIAGRPSGQGATAADRRSGGAPAQPAGTVQPFEIGDGFAGHVKAKRTRQDLLSRLEYKVFKAGTPAERFDLARELASVDIQQHLDGSWEVEMLASYRKGMATRLYNAIEADLGIRLSPSGLLTPDGHGYWSKRSPASVAWHRRIKLREDYGQDTDLYYSPRNIKHHIADLKEKIASLLRVQDPVDWERKHLARSKENLAKFQAAYLTLPKAARQAIQTMFALGGETDQTKAAAFRRWFGDSKVVDEDGDPLVVYHGSGAPLYRFDISRAGSGTDSGILGQGFYFSTSEKIARFYRRAGGELYSVYLKIENPFVVNGSYFSTPDESRAYLGGNYPSFYTKMLDLTNQFTTSHPDVTLEDYGLENALRDFDYGADAGRDIARAIREMLEDHGYDGVQFNFPGNVAGTEYVAFEPTQIKSANSNRGTFDPDNPDIAAALGGGDAGNIRSLPLSGKSGRLRILERRLAFLLDEQDLAIAEGRPSAEIDAMNGSINDVSRELEDLRLQQHEARRNSGLFEARAKASDQERTLRHQRQDLEQDIEVQEAFAEAAPAAFTLRRGLQQARQRLAALFEAEAEAKAELDRIQAELADISFALGSRD